MKRVRFSIATLLGAVLLVALSIAALREATDAWDSGLFGLTLLALLTGVLLAVHRSGKKRAFWLGFALFGVAYIAGSMIPQIEGRLPTSKGLAYVDSLVPGRAATVTFRIVGPGSAGTTNTVTAIEGLTVSSGWSTGANNPQGGGTVWFENSLAGALTAGPYGTSVNFIRIGHSILALVFALLGGWLSSYLFARGRTRPEERGGASELPSAGA
jgi:hypothetical protein